MKWGLTNTEYNLMPFQDAVKDLVTMICLNPVKEGEEFVKRGLFPKLKDLHALVRSNEIKEILVTDAITEDGELKVVKYFNIKQKMGLPIGRMGRSKENSYWFQTIF